MELKDRVAFVTGSTSGIGKAVAQKLLNLGCSVIISSEKDITEQEVLKDFENSSNATYLKCDISIKSDIDNANEVIKSKFGKLDYLVCNAGIMSP